MRHVLICVELHIKHLLLQPTCPPYTTELKLKTQGGGRVQKVRLVPQTIDLVVAGRFTIKKIEVVFETNG